METIKIFRKSNKISQVALAEYLNVTQGFISQMENGTSAIPDSIISKILANPYSWNTSMLTSNQPEVPAEEKPTTENSLLEYLQRKIEKLEREKEELLQENAVLKYENMMLTPRKGDAEDVGNSLSASAV